MASKGSESCLVLIRAHFDGHSHKSTRRASLSVGFLCLFNVYACFYRVHPALSQRSDGCCPRALNLIHYQEKIVLVNVTFVFACLARFVHNCQNAWP